jgi:hypothetical protein
LSTSVLLLIRKWNIYDSIKINNNVSCQGETFQLYRWGHTINGRHNNALYSCYFSHWIYSINTILKVNNRGVTFELYLSTLWRLSMKYIWILRGYISGTHNGQTNIFYAGVYRHKYLVLGRDKSNSLVLVMWVLIDKKIINISLLVTSMLQAFYIWQPNYTLLQDLGILRIRLIVV